MVPIRIRLYECYLLGMLILSRLLTITFRRKHDIWLIAERGEDARDNGYHLFKYMKNHHPNISVKYLIKADSPDRKKLAFASSDVINYGSFLHFIYLWRANYLISTHSMGYANHSLFLTLNNKFNIFGKRKRVFLQHGITKDDLPMLYYKNLKIDMFCTGAYPEYKFIKERFGYPEGVVKYTGFCRYDNLNRFVKKKQILIMPTWRKYINKNKFEESVFYTQYSNLLSNSNFVALLEKYGFKAIFYPHYEFQPLISSFKKLALSPLIEIADFNYDVQQLLKESAMLITDYSSVYFDMAYMSKPIIYFQFDNDEFRAKHYKRGYFREESLGTVTYDLEALLSELSKILCCGCKMKEEHLKYSNYFFKYRDSMNCERVYNSITSL